MPIKLTDPAVIEFFDNMLYDGLPYGFFAIGLVLTYRYLRFIDLTFSSSFVLGPTIVAWFSKELPEIPIVSINSLWVSIPAAIAATTILCVLTIFQIRKLGLDGLLASLLTSLVGFSLALMISEGTLEVDRNMNILSFIKEADRDLGANPSIHPFQIITFSLLLVFVKFGVDKFLSSEKGLVFRSLEDENSFQFLLPSLGIKPGVYYTGGIIAGNLLCMMSGLLIMYRETKIDASRGFEVFLTVIIGYLLGTTLFMKTPGTWFSGPEGEENRWKNLLVYLHKLKKLNPTSASIIGILIYFSILSFVANYPEIPKSLPKILVVFLVLFLFYLFELPEITRKREIGKSNSSIFSEGATSLTVKKVSVSFPGFSSPNIVLKEAACEFPLGQVTQLTGPNGSGKSTFLQYLAGYVDGRGEVCIPKNTNKPSRGGDRKTAISYIPQHAKLSTCNFLTVEDHFALYYKGNEPRVFQKIKKNITFGKDGKGMLDSFFEKIKKSPVGVLSGGERQILSISSLFLRPDSPRIILFDEPLSYLDEDNAQVCVDLIESLAKKGCGIILVQHDIQKGLIYSKSNARTKLSNLISKQVDIKELQLNES